MDFSKQSTDDAICVLTSTKQGSNLGNIPYRMKLYPDISFECQYQYQSHVSRLICGQHAYNISWALTNKVQNGIQQVTVGRTLQCLGRNVAGTMQ